MAKQSVRRGEVKVACLAPLLCVAVLALSACAGSQWHNARKSPQEARADERECNRRAEEGALARAGRQRADYQNAPMRAGEPYRADTPMDLVERNDTTNQFHRQMESCMASKGYSQGKSGPQP